jgi:hypothetical protein
MHSLSPSLSFLNISHLLYMAHVRIVWLHQGVPQEHPDSALRLACEVLTNTPSKRDECLGKL